MHPPELPLDLWRPGVWDTGSAFEYLTRQGHHFTRRTLERRLRDALPNTLTAIDLVDEEGRAPISQVVEAQIAEARKRRELVLFAQIAELPNGVPCLHCNDARGARFWLATPASAPFRDGLRDALAALRAHVGRPVTMFPHTKLARYRTLEGAIDGLNFCVLGYPDSTRAIVSPVSDRATYRSVSDDLDRLEAESIYIIREAVAEARAPVMLFSAGLSSTVMLYLARKAFHPSPPPFPLLHVDTRWKFRETYEFRDQAVAQAGMSLIVHVDAAAAEKDINPFDQGAEMHTRIAETEALGHALKAGDFDVAFFGRRRDAEAVSAKERIFSARGAGYRWDPGHQRAEVWNLYNARTKAGDSMRVHPLANWSEIDVWRYVERESIPISPLHFAKMRPVVARHGTWIAVDDDRFRLVDGDRIEPKRVRFRSLGCYPLTGAIESQADSVPAIIAELLAPGFAQRTGRRVDADAYALLEMKKREGHF
jgi:sulfate adenylyltransferase subunit 2